MDFLTNKEDYRHPLCKVSLDDEKSVSLIDTCDLIYNFDGIAKHLCEELQRGESVASCDALLENEGQYYFLEFKNQPQRKIRPNQIAKKAFQSFNLFRLAIEQKMSVDEARDHLTLFVIYADEQEAESYQNFREKLHGLAKMPEEGAILFDLRRIKGKLYKEVYTIPVSDFMYTWYPIFFSNT